MNKYTILSLVLIASVIMLISFSPEEDTVEITGYAGDLHEGQNGYTFSITDSDGKETRAFYRGTIDNSLHVFKGTYSSDGKMLFVNKID